jgi:flagellar motility protein MotE (MotC chaperone)
VLVVDAMSERKVSPILANMNPLNAKKLTMELAEDRKLKEDSEKKLDAMTK